MSQKSSHTHLLSLLAAGVFFAATVAQAAPIVLDLPAQPLADSLRQVAEAAGLTLAVDSTLLKGRDAPALNGRMEPDDAISRLLASSGLMARREEGVIVVQRSPAPTPAVPVKLDQITVTAERSSGYAPSISSAGSKGELDIRDVPQAITVFGEDLLRDLAPRVLDDIADYVAGVDREGVTSNPYAISFFFRGFNSAGAGNSYNGFREDGFETPQAAINVERIEFLKGPASVLYGGSSALSGLVNIVSKQPLDEQVNRIETTIGSFDHLLTTLDSTGPLTADKSLRYRLTAAADKGGNFVKGTEQQSLFISPVLSWDVSDRTQLDVELLNQDINRPGRQNPFQRHPDFFRLPVDVQLGDPGVPAGSGGTLTRRLARVDLTHRFANGWRLRQGLFASNVHSDDTTIQVISYDPETGDAGRRVRKVEGTSRTRDSQTELSGETRTGFLLHQWLAGAEISHNTSGGPFNIAPYTSINIFGPAYPGVQTGPLSNDPAFMSGTNTRGLYVQDLMTLGAGFKLLAGGRHDWLESFSQTEDGVSPKDSQDDTAFSPRVGLIWQPSDTLSWYGSWNRSFSPNVGRQKGGGSFSPERGEQVEAGLKADVRSGLSVTAAVFEYRRKNVLTTDASDDQFSRTVGEQRSRGFELEAIGEITPDWSVVASYGFLDAEVTRDTDLPEGNRLSGVPRHSAALFNRLALRRLGLERWSLTAGIAYAGERESGLPNDPDGDGPLRASDVRLPSYINLDAGLLYVAPRYELRLNGRNLADDEIYDGYFSTFQPRAPRSVEASVAVKF